MTTRAQAQMRSKQLLRKMGLQVMMNKKKSLNESLDENQVSKKVNQIAVRVQAPKKPYHQNYQVNWQKIGRRR